MKFEEESTDMVMKRYPAEFRADAVALYRSRPAATYGEIADELGVNRETLRGWIRKDDGERRGAAVAGSTWAGTTAGESLEQENRRLRSQVAELEAEREILRRAAAYIAKETKW